MISLNRTKNNRWIMQKNISSKEQIMSFLEALRRQSNYANMLEIRDSLRSEQIYRGRSEYGSVNTMGVRLSQIKFYMFGYYDSINKVFIPSPMLDILRKEPEKESEIGLVNLFSMQFPHPYSETPENFNIYFGRLIVKLLLEEKLNNKLYIDEIIYFLPFIESINKLTYIDLIDSIVEFRSLDYDHKVILFKEVSDYNDIFSNCMHEMKYYFLRIFKDFGVFSIVSDLRHNEGKLLKFTHGISTIRNDSYDSRKNNSGYVELNNKVIDKAKLLIDKCPFYEMPITQADSLTYSSWLRDLYELEPLKYLSIIDSISDKTLEVVSIIDKMVYTSKYGSRDGRQFEESLKEVFEWFREVKDIEIISGSGDTDIVCVMEDNRKRELYKINIDAKSSSYIVNSLNSRRLSQHLKKNGSKYCIVVSPRFSKGARLDIESNKIVTIEAEALANYCAKECINSIDNLASFDKINIIIEGYMGTDITKKIEELTSSTYGIS